MAILAHEIDEYLRVQARKTGEPTDRRYITCPTIAGHNRKLLPFGELTNETENS